MSWINWARLLNVIFLVGVASCTSRPPTTPSVTLDDEVITAEVMQRINSEPSLRSATIMVDTHHGLVTLRGVAEDAIDRNLAESLARGVEGVLEVQNLIETRRQGRSFFFRRR